MSGAFQISLPNLLYAAEDKTKHRTAHEQKILQYLESHDSIDKTSAASLIGTKDARAYIVLRTMAESGLLAVQKQGKKYVYVKQ